MIINITWKFSLLPICTKLYNALRNPFVVSTPCHTIYLSILSLVTVCIRSLMKIENSERRLQISIWARNGPKYADSPGCGWPSKGERDLSWSTRQGRDVSESSPRDLSFNQILSKETFLHPTSLSEMVLWVRKKFNTHWYIEDGELLSYFFIV